MISNFSSFVEFFAAVYVTMAVNNDFCSNFWTPKYYQEMELLLKTYDFSGSSSIHDKLMADIKAKYEMVQKYAHFRGFVLLTLCICYLIFMGYETEENSKAVNHYVPLLYSTVLVGITILFSGKILVKWKHAVLTVFIYFSVYLILKVGNWSAIADFPLSTFLFEVKSFLLVLIVILPIIYQIFIYWLHSSIYKGYLKYHVALEYNRFKKSMEGIKTRDKSKVDKIYMDAWTDAVFASNEDPTLTSFYKVLNKQLANIASPSYRDLLYSWLSFHWNKIQCENNKNGDIQTVANVVIQNLSQQNLSVQAESTYSETLDFSEEYKLYCKWKKTVGKNGNVKAFCISHGLTYKDMVAWLRVNKPEKKNLK